MGAISWFLNFLIITALIFSHVSVVASFSAIPSNTIDHKFKRFPIKRKLRQPPSPPPPPHPAPPAVVTFKTHEAMMDALESELSDLRAWISFQGYNELGSEEEDPQTVNDDKAISSDEPHPRKADVDDFEIIIHQCLGRFAIFDPNSATNLTASSIQSQKMQVSYFMLLLMIFFAPMLPDHQLSIGYRAMAFVSDRSPELGRASIASTSHFSAEVKVGQLGRSLRRAVPSPPPPQPNRWRGHWRWLVPPPPESGGPLTPPPPPMPLLLPPSSPPSHGA
ncbi:hypothetical protein DKX38_029061 [Salix brachista]|uniref:Uncharacterized protein n=1 Tax=Salix brachista TaxID=2182728 RepID=A0A5N5J406_9ROSI|nr:hypothetical protein DKX38_029061 [Salix brachista]